MQTILEAGEVQEADQLTNMLQEMNESEKEALRIFLLGVRYGKASA